MSSNDLIALAASHDGYTRDLLFSLAATETLAESIRACTLCPLSSTATAPVPWNGVRSPIALIGEAPGAEEDRLGAPFLGRAGRLLDTLLSSLDLTRHDVALINTICCRPPRNDYDIALSSNAVSACSPWFTAQLAMSGAWLIVPMGNSALAKFRDNASISQWRGKGWWMGSRYIMPTYHPAYALRNPEARMLMARDLAPLRAILDGSSDLPPPTDPSPSLSLFAVRTHDPRLSSVFKKKGWVVVYSAVLGVKVVMVRDHAVVIPEPYAHLVRYTADEIVRMVGTSVDTKRRVHLLKEALDAEVVV